MRSSAFPIHDFSLEGGFESGVHGLGHPGSGVLPLAQGAQGFWQAHFEISATLMGV
jgi:hypothetical protein